MKKQLIISVSILFFLLIATSLVVLYGKGFRFTLFQGRPELSHTGMLVAVSTPDGAQVFVDGHLTTATDNTINLAPGDYEVRIAKEGYFPWEKKVKIQEEVVTKAEAFLFPSAPKLESITGSGVENPVIDPSFTKIAYTISSQSARKNGIYILDMGQRPILTLQSASTQIADDTVDFFSKSRVLWSPDGTQLIASISSALSTSMYLLKGNGFNEQPSDITATLSSLNSLWEQEIGEKERARVETLPSTLKKMISDNFTMLLWSPDETKILYMASQSATLPIIIKPRLIGTESTPETRVIKKEDIYVYDMKEDKNYKLEIPPCHPDQPWAEKDLDSSPSAQNDKGNSQNDKKCLSWFPDSKHLIYVHDKKIDIMEYSSTNQTTIYAGPFIDNYVFPWTNTSKILILTNLGNSNSAPNLYTVSLK